MSEPASPSGLALEAISSSGIRATWVDNASYSAGANEILHLLFSPTPVGGTWTLSFDLETSASIAYDADAAAVQAALEAMPSIGAGNVSVTAITGGFAIEFIGAASNLDIDVADVTVDDSLLYQAADTVTITEVQSGVADVPSTPSIETTTTAVEPIACQPSITTTQSANSVDTPQIDTITFDGTAVAGSMWIEGQLLGWDVDASTLSFGGATASGAPASGTITITWSDFESHTPFSVSAQTLLSVVGVQQVDTITFSAPPVAGSMTINSSSLPYNEPGSGLGSMGIGVVVDGTPASGPLTVTWGDYTSHTPLDVDAGTMKSVVGREQRLTISLDDSPDSGEWFLTSSGSQFGSNLNYNADVAAILAVLNGYGDVAYDWYGNEFFTTSNDPGIPSLGADGHTLAKPGVSAGLTTEQNGSPQSWAELGFWIQTSLDGSSWSDFIELGVNVTTWDLSGLNASTLYYVRVRAYNADGDSGYSNVESESTLAAAISGRSSSSVTIGVSL